jgi:hypothetical protein
VGRSKLLFFCFAVTLERGLSRKCNWPGWPDSAKFRLCIEQLFTYFGQFCENFRSSTNNWAIFAFGKSYLHMFWPEMVLAMYVGTFWSIFFTNPSGYPASDRTGKTMLYVIGTYMIELVLDQLSCFLKLIFN